MTTWTLAASLAQLRAEYDARWPGRDTASDGTIGDAAHSSRTSDHNPDAAGVVRALDLDKDVAAGVDGAADLAEHLRLTRDPRIKYAISRGRMFSSYWSGDVPPFTWRTYYGDNGHFEHVHVSVVADDALAQDARPWGYALAGAPVRTDPVTDPMEEFMSALSDAEQRRMLGILDNLNTWLPQIKANTDRIPSVDAGVDNLEWGVLSDAGLRVMLAGLIARPQQVQSLTDDALAAIGQAVADEQARRLTTTTTAGE